MDASAPIQIAETIQTMSINRNPSPTHDINPSTAASEKVPVDLGVERRDSIASFTSSVLGSEFDNDEDDYYTVRPKVARRRASLPPLPDLRFEQSYLRSIEGADTYGKIAIITLRDQVILPLLQGTLWTLALHGWRHWNRATKLSGQSMGARVRRWWWGVNNWSLDESAGSVFKSTLKDKKLAREIGEVRGNQFETESLRR